MIDKVNLGLSKDTSRAIKDVLVQHENLDSNQIREVISGIDLSCRLAVMMDIPESPSAVRSELEALNQSIDKLFNAVRGTSQHSMFALWETARLDKADTELADYGEDGGWEYEFKRLAHRATRITKAVELTLNKMNVPKGPPPDTRARHLAYQVLDSLEHQGVNSTSYDNGTYLQILGHVFEDVMPNSSYIRHGRWALSNPVLERAFLKPF